MDEFIQCIHEPTLYDGGETQWRGKPNGGGNPEPSEWDAECKDQRSELLQSQQAGVTATLKWSAD